MKTTEIFKKHTVLSFEVFPPKRTGAVDTIYSTLEELQKLHPDFIVRLPRSGRGNYLKDYDIWE